jgi:phosphatidylserine/phosphatidylglycerophosphate/cardiolipin synthase-like enzyme
MSPWMNFAVQDYTSTFRHLIEHDVTIRLLFRLPSPRGWNNLKQNLLTRLGDTGGNLELRTYTRFKQFRNHTELKEIGKDDKNYVGETGIHAKLFIAGGAEDGSVVAGSANLMENSFFYNPEAGLQTHDPNVVKTAINYYDLIWKLSEPDRIDESVFTNKTNFTFYPKVYKP